MSCYLRHLGPLLERVGYKPESKEQRKLVDQSVRAIIGIDKGNCPEVWREVKEWLKDPEKETHLVEQLKKKLV